MAFNVILTNLAGTQTDAAVLNGALTIASAGSRSHIHALLTRPDPTSVIMMGEEAVSPTMYQDIIEAAQRADTELVRRTRAHFDKWCARNGIKSSDEAKRDNRPLAYFRDAIGTESRVLAQAARLADITVMERPKPENRFDPAFETALLESGHPVMLVPPGTHAAAAVSSILIAWNDSPEAARAVSSALPLLKAAGQVTVFTSAEGAIQASTADMLIDYLGEHEIQATIFPSVRQRNQSVEEKLLFAVRKTKADLLVMGAYTHSRVRELVFGGVTRHMLTHAPVPVLMSH